MPRICVLGSANMDLVVHAPHLPVPGETELGGPFGTFPGGKGANQAVAAARLGAKTRLIGAVGDDAFGAELRAALVRDDVDAHLQVVMGTASGVALITVDALGENTIVVAPGANLDVTSHDVARHRSDIASADVFLAQLECPLDTVEAGARIAHERGVHVVLNAAPADPGAARILPFVDTLVVNRVEAEALATAEPGADAPSLARALRALGPRLIVVTLGADGALAFDGERIRSQQAFPIDAVDTVAAGDAFVGALAEALARGLPVDAALRRGCAAGAIAATRHGAQPSLPTAVEVDELLAR